MDQRFKNLAEHPNSKGLLHAQNTKTRVAVPPSDQAFNSNFPALRIDPSSIPQLARPGYPILLPIRPGFPPGILAPTRSIIHHPSIHIATYPLPVVLLSSIYPPPIHPPSIHSHTHLSIHTSIHLPIYLSSIHPHTHLYSHPPISVHPSTHISSIHLPTYISIHHPSTTLDD